VIFSRFKIESKVEKVKKSLFKSDSESEKSEKITLPEKDYKRFREICDDVGAILLTDMAHGL